MFITYKNVKKHISKMSRSIYLSPKNVHETHKYQQHGVPMLHICHTEKVMRVSNHQDPKLHICHTKITLKENIIVSPSQKQCRHVNDHWGPIVTYKSHKPSAKKMGLYHIGPDVTLMSPICKSSYIYHYLDIYNILLYQTLPCDLHYKMQYCFQLVLTW